MIQKLGKKGAIFLRDDIWAKERQNGGEPPPFPRPGAHLIHIQNDSQSLKKMLSTF